MDASRGALCAGTVIYRIHRALDQFRQVPAAWYATRLLDGAPGVSVTLACRAGERWFVGSMSATPARTQTVPLGFLAPGCAYTARTYADGPDGRIAGSEQTVTGASTLAVPVAANGGFAVILTPRG